MNKKLVGIVIGCMILAIGALFWGIQFYIKNYKGSYDLLKTFKTPTILSFTELPSEQTLKFDQGETYVIEGSVYDLQTAALSIKLLLPENISDESALSRQDSAVSLMLLACDNDMFGREYCAFMPAAGGLHARHIQFEDGQLVTGRVDCGLIDPYERVQTDPECFTVRRDATYTRSIIHDRVPTWWTEPNKKSRWKLVINPLLPETSYTSLVRLSVEKR